MTNFIMKFIDEWLFRICLGIFWTVIDFYGVKFSNKEMGAMFLFATLLDYHSMKHQELMKRLDELKKLLEEKK